MLQCKVIFSEGGGGGGGTVVGKRAVVLSVT